MRWYDFLGMAVVYAGILGVGVEVGALLERRRQARRRRRLQELRGGRS